MGIEGKVNINGITGITTQSDIHPIVLDQLATGAIPAIAIQIASHPRTLRSTLCKLAQSENVDVRCAVGENMGTPADVLWKLARDEHPDVRFSLAENHNLAIDILRYLARDENPYVANRAERTMTRLGESQQTNIAVPSPMFAFAS